VGLSGGNPRLTLPSALRLLSTSSPLAMPKLTAKPRDPQFKKDSAIFFCNAGQFFPLEGDGQINGLPKQGTT
jgi:hypothetical protein